MPFSAKIHRDPDLQHICASGILTLGEVRHQFAVAPSMPGHYPGIPTLIDFRGLRGAETGLADLMSLRDRLAERHGVAGRPFRMALFADNEIAFGIARIFETVCTQSDGVDARVFQSLADTFAFLELLETGLARALLDEPRALRA